MKIAYLASLYPAVSHTFILREVMILRRLGMNIDTFSIRAPRKRDLLGKDAENEAENTDSILPISAQSIVSALLWCLLHKKRMFFSLFLHQVLQKGNLKTKFYWLIYLLEGVILAHKLHKGGHDHLHCHFGNSASNTAYLAAKLAGIAFSITLHGSELHHPEKFRIPLKVKESKFIVCISKYGKSRVMSVCSHAYWHKLKLVHCGLEYDGEAADAAGKSNTNEIVCVGRLSPEKGHYVLLDAISILEENNVNVHVSLIGDGPIRNELEVYAAAKLSSKSYSFLGALSSEDVKAYYEKCSAVVLSSFSEGIPVVLMEAFSFSKPVVATRVGGVPELVDNMVNGVVVSPGDAEELAEAIIFMLKNSKEAAVMGKKGYQKARREFNLSASAETLLELFAGSNKG